MCNHWECFGKYRIVSPGLLQVDEESILQWNEDITHVWHNHHLGLSQGTLNNKWTRDELSKSRPVDRPPSWKIRLDGTGSIERSTKDISLPASSEHMPQIYVSWRTSETNNEWMDDVSRLTFISTIAIMVEITLSCLPDEAWPSAQVLLFCTIIAKGVSRITKSKYAAWTLSKHCKD